MLAYITAVFLALVGMYILIAKTNLIKKVIGLSLFTNSVHLFLISLGYREGGIAPIIQNLGMNELLASDPVVQAMVLTSIVISLSITAFALTLIVQVHRRFNTLDSKELRSLKG